MNYKLFDYFLLFQFVKSFIAKLQEKFIKFINSYVKISSKLPDIHISCIVVSQQKYLSLHIKISSKYHARYIWLKRFKTGLNINIEFKSFKSTYK